VKVFLAGEGKTELGDLADHPSYRQDPPEPGLLEALLRRLHPSGCSVAGAVKWKDIHKYRAHDRCRAEVRNVMGAAVQAKDAGCRVLAFSRDRDGDEQREKDVMTGIHRARAEIDGCPDIAGGMAVEAIEAWLISMQGDHRAESRSDPRSLLRDADLAAKRAIVETANLDKLPSSARSLQTWLDRAAKVLGLGPPGSRPTTGKT
jgi:hypothetical protein